MTLIFKNFFSTLRRYKVASVLNIVGLSVAFAAFAVMMMQVRYDLTYDAFHSNYDRIFRVETKWLEEDGSEPEGEWNTFAEGLSTPMFRVVEGLSPEIVGSAKLRSEGGAREFKTDPRAEESFREAVRSLSPGTLRVFDFRIVAGDTSLFDQPGKALISQSQAGKMFPGSDPIGRVLYRGDEAREVIAVYEDFPVNSTLDNRIYYRSEPNRDDDQVGSINGSTYILLSSPDKKEEVEQVIQQELSRLFEEESGPNRYRLTSLHDTHYTTDNMSDDTEKIDPTRTYLLLSVALLIILIAAINFVNFALSLAPSRARGISIQKVFGNGNGAIRRAMVFEAVGLCVMAVLIAIWIVAVLRDTGFASLLPVDMRWSENYSVMGTMILIALATGVLAGSYPAFRIASLPVGYGVKGDYGSSAGGKRLRMLLVSFQYFVSLALIIVAGFIYLQNHFMQHHSMGLKRENVLTFSLEGELRRKQALVHDALLQNPGIEAVAFAAGDLFTTSTSTQGGDYLGKGDITVNVKYISPGLLDLFGIELVEGRDFREGDTLVERGAFIYNQAASRKYDIHAGDILTEYYPAEGDEEEFREDRQVVGIIRDFNYEPLGKPIEPMAFEYWKPGSSLSCVYLRVSGNDIPATIDFIRRTIRTLDPGGKEPEVRFFDETIGRYYEKQTRLAQLLAIFSALAILISLIGVFGLVLFETQYRRKEIGIRKVHGATISEILRLLNSGFVRIVLICFVVAAPIAYYFVRKWLEGFAYRTPVHWWVFGVALLVVLLLTLLTVTLQSYRAATENPVNSIKTE